MLPHARRGIAQGWNTVDGVDRQAVPVGLIPYSQLKWRIDVALFLVAPHVEVVLTRPLVGETVDEPGVRVEVEDDGFVGGEDGPPLAVRHTVRMIGVGDKAEQVNHVDKTDLELG